MIRFSIVVASFALVLLGCSSEPVDTTETAEAESNVASVAAEELCLDAGPQTPRDISSKHGLNQVSFELAPAATDLNLCNIHTHTNAEHKGPGFSIFVDDSEHGGYACNGSADLSDAEREPLEGAFEGAVPGDTIEVHWVHSSCDITPGEGLGSCLNEACSDPLLRVEAQTFLVVNDSEALDFADFGYGGTSSNGLHQAASLPSGTGDPVEFLGSTTGPSYTQSECSPMQVTWNVRPQCAKLDIASLHRWAESDNVFNETKSHGVRQLVVAPELLSPIL